MAEKWNEKNENIHVVFRRKTKGLGRSLGKWTQESQYDRDYALHNKEKPLEQLVGFCKNCYFKSPWQYTSPSNENCHTNAAGIRPLLWPSRSSGLNSFENMWNYLKIKVMLKGSFPKFHFAKRTDQSFGPNISNVLRLVDRRHATTRWGSTASWGNMRHWIIHQFIWPHYIIRISYYDSHDHPTGCHTWPVISYGSVITSNETERSQGKHPLRHSCFQHLTEKFRTLFSHIYIYINCFGDTIELIWRTTESHCGKLEESCFKLL